MLLSQHDSDLVNYTSHGFKLVQAPGVALVSLFLQLPKVHSLEMSGEECQQTAAEFWQRETQELMRQPSLHAPFA